jgi:hypothetical protein
MFSLDSTVFFLLSHILYSEHAVIRKTTVRRCSLFFSNVFFSLAVSFHHSVFCMKTAENSGQELATLRVGVKKAVVKCWKIYLLAALGQHKCLDWLLFTIPWPHTYIQGPYSETIDLWFEPFFAKVIRHVIEWLHKIKHCYKLLLIQQNKFVKLNVN